MVRAANASRDDVRRVLVAGDTHGNTAWVEGLVHTAAEQGCPIVILVGDFGYFPDLADGPRFLTAVDTACSNHGVELWFIDGNHDDHFGLAQHREVDAPVALTDHVTSIPRAARVALGGLTFGFLGGAFSVDWRDRTHGIDWWPSETPDHSDVARLGTERLDILITHDAPAGVDLAASRLPAEDQVRADETRSLTWRSTRVVGLGCDGDPAGGWMVLELDSLDIGWPTATLPGPTSQDATRDESEVET